jgi:general secretion pathway protein H
MSAPPERRARRQPSGFTLLELMVVIAIMAALTALFPLALNRFVPARRVDAAARALVADLRLAQARSVASGKPVTVEPTAHGYRIASVAAREWRSSTEIALKSLDGSAGMPALRVFADGSSTGGRFTIRDGERERAVTVSELTGRLRLDPAAPVEAPGS